MTITLTQFMEECRKLVMQGKEVYIKGNGDSTWNLVVEDEKVIFGDGDNETTTNK